MSRKRVPYIQQLNATECGVACLAMVLTSLGRPTSLAEVRDVCPVGRDGLGVKTLASAARLFGLNVKAYAAEVGDLKNICLPAIVHWQFNHFVVIEEIGDKQVTIVDPACGRRTLETKTFSADFTGIVLTMEPAVSFGATTNTSNKSLLRRFSLFSGVSKKLLPHIIIASVLIQLFGLAAPLLSKIAFDDVLPVHQVSLLNVVVLGIVLMIVTQAFVGYIRNVALVSLRNRIDHQLMTHFVAHMFSLPFSFFQQRTTGDLLLRVSSNAVIRELITTQTLSVLLDGTFLTGYLVLLLILLPVFGIAVLVIALTQLLVVYISYGRAAALAQEDLTSTAKQQGYLVEAVKGICLLKASGSEHRSVDRWSNLFHAQLNISSKRGSLNALVNSLVGGIQTAAPVLLLYIGTRYAVAGSISVGTVLALQGIAVGFLTPLGSLVATAQQFQLADAHLQRVADVLDAVPDPSNVQPDTAVEIHGEIEFRDVSFRYSPEAPWVLQNVSFTVKPNTTCAVLGTTGSGKSTLSLLIMGVIQPTSGDIFIDGRPMRTINHQSLRDQIGIVLQEPFLFSGSIRQNIEFGRPAMGFDVVIRAARIAAFHDDVTRMPMEYETRLSEGGANISGGQRQRLALARAIANEPKILILDEATSHLDVETEAKVAKSLREFQRTKIVVAHRLSTVRDADQILIMEAGRIVENGGHQELVEMKGRYWELLNTDVRGISANRSVEEMASPVETHCA